LFIVPVVESLLRIRRLPDVSRVGLLPSVQARLTVNIPSQAGREDWIPVRLSASSDDYYAEPLFGKSNLIFTLVRADGLICIPPDVTGLPAGELVKVLFL
jgi:molybdopterin molybdotransferase